MKNKLTVIIGLLWLTTLSTVLYRLHLQTKSELARAAIEIVNLDSGLKDIKIRDYTFEVTETADINTNFDDINISSYAAPIIEYVSAQPYDLDALYHGFLEVYPARNIEVHTDDLSYYDEHIQGIELEDNSETPDAARLVPSVNEVSLGTFELTAYCSCVECCGEWSAYHASNINTGYVQKTASGTTPREGRTISVDPNVIPLGTELVIDGKLVVAEDTGSAIKGYRIDVYFDDHQEALEFGRQKMEVFGYKDCCGEWITQQAYIEGV